MASAKRAEAIFGVLTSNQELTSVFFFPGQDTSKKSNKIVFDDDDDGKPAQKSKLETRKSTEASTSKSKLTLFNEDDSDEEADSVADQQKFEVRKEFQGEKGEKLWKLQSRFQTDKRFAMDAKFIDDDDDFRGEQAEHRHEDRGKAKEDEEADDMEKERQWQFDILEKVIGKKLHNGNALLANEKKNTSK